jgi:pimeloyl-ACP methyl ester carboxylesterase
MNVSSMFQQILRCAQDDGGVAVVATFCVTLAAGACGSALQVAPVPIAHPSAPSYADATARIASQQLQDDSVVVSGGRSILMTHGAAAARVYVLLHGFTDAPSQFAPIGTDLFADGANVYIPRLPHHAERASPLRAIARVRSDELARFADSTAEIARGLGDTIVVVGMSAGGVLAGWIAQFHPEVRRAVLIAPAIAPGRLGDDEGGGLVILASKLPDIVRMTAPIDTARPENIPGITTRGLSELLRLGRRVHDTAETIPPGVHDIVFLLNESDHTVSEGAALELAQRWTDRGAEVSALRFNAATKLPHNVMELTSHGGNTALVYPIVESLARGIAVEKLDTLTILGRPCTGFKCNLRRWVHIRGN